MKRLLAAAGLALIASLPAAAPAAAQSQGWATTNVNMRSGPGTEYPPVLVVPAGAPLTVFGCIEGYGWCDVAFEEARGFVSGRLIAYEYQNVRRPVVEIGPQIALPVIAFALGSYWDSHYRSRPFYRDRDRWDRRYHAAPPPRGYRPPPRPVYQVDRPRPPVYRPDRRDHDRSRFEQDRRREMQQRRAIEQRHNVDRQREMQQRRREVYRQPDQPRRHERQEFRRDGSPRSLSGGQTERDAQRFNRGRTGPEPGN
ncbi:peptide-binding protein [Allostella vacuolata]|nr:peptide-binding protein [Stella vacuolata]